MGAPIATETRINHWSQRLREQFGGRVQRVALDAGMTCPNLDGKRAVGGCTFCDASGSLAPYGRARLPIREQLERGIRHMRRRFGADRFIAYLQSHTNTHAPVEHLRAVFAEALDHPDVVGLAIGTRPDCLPNDVLDLLAETSATRPLWLEIGLESASDATLERVNRAHTVAEWEVACGRAKARGLFVATHLILGLPGDTAADWHRAVDLINRHRLDGVKFHMLYIDRHARLAAVHRREPLTLLSREEYVDAVCDLLQRLDPRVAVMRLVSECPADRLVAPRWLLDKPATTEAIEAEIGRRGSRQGELRQAT